MECTIRLLDEVNCVIVGLHSEAVEYLWDVMGRFAPNYYHQPKYKLGVWDGKIRYFHRTGRTFVHLLDEVIPILTELKCQIKIEDLRAELPTPPTPINEDFFSNVYDPRSDGPWKVRDYQIELVNTLLDAGNGVGVAGTGAGKTSMTAAIALSYELAHNLRSIIIVPDKNLTAQTIQGYKDFGLDVGEYSGSKKDLDHSHIVSTWQSLKNNPHILHQFQVVIVDECHGLRGNVLTDLLTKHGANILFRFGVTGTIPKDETDALAIKVAVGPVRYTIPAHELIEQGVLSNLHIDIIQHKQDVHVLYDQYIEECDEIGETPLTYAQFKKQCFPDWASERNFIQSDDARLKWIASYVHERSAEEKGNTLILVNGINFGKKLAKNIPDAIFLYGQDEMDVRQRAYKMFATSNHIVVVATAKIASTGLDINRIFHLMYVDMGRSFIRTIQSIGRGLRKGHDKDFVHVTDICTDTKYSAGQLRDRISFYKEAKYPHTRKAITITPINSVLSHVDF